MVKRIVHGYDGKPMQIDVPETAETETMTWEEKEKQMKLAGRKSPSADRTYPIDRRDLSSDEGLVAMYQEDNDFPENQVQQDNSTFLYVLADIRDALFDIRDVLHDSQE